MHDRDGQLLRIDFDDDAEFFLQSVPEGLEPPPVVTCRVDAQGPGVEHFLGMPLGKVQDADNRRLVHCSLPGSEESLSLQPNRDVIPDPDVRGAARSVSNDLRRGFLWPRFSANRESFAGDDLDSSCEGRHEVTPRLCWCTFHDLPIMS